MTDALQEQIEHSAGGYDAAWQMFLTNGWIELPPLDAKDNPERIPWDVDKPLSIDRDRLRGALDHEVERLRGP